MSGSTITAKDAVRKLKAAGFVEVHQKGSHLKLRHPDGRRAIVPMHRGELKRKTARAIEIESKVSLTED